MGFVSGPNTKVIVADVDLSGFLNSVSLPSEASTAQTTCFGKTAHTYIPILKDGTVALGGFFDGAVDAVDEELSAAMGGSAKVVTVALSGLTAGDRAKLMTVHFTNYEISGEVDGVVEVSAEGQAAASGIEAGVALQYLTESGGGTFGTAVDNGAATTNGGVGHLHVLAASGTTPGLITRLQHSPDNVTFADIDSFTTASTRTSERLEVTGTIDRYVRARTFLTGTTPSFTYVVSFARR